MFAHLMILLALAIIADTCIDMYLSRKVVKR